MSRDSPCAGKGPRGLSARILDPSSVTQRRDLMSYTTPPIRPLTASATSSAVTPTSLAKPTWSLTPLITTALVTSGPLARRALLVNTATIIIRTTPGPTPLMSR